MSHRPPPRAFCVLGMFTRLVPGAWPTLRWLAAVLIVGVAVPATAATTVYRCVKNGQTILGDKPCDGTPESSSAAPPTQTTSTVASSSNPSPTGVWRGQMQYQGRESGQTLEQAHSVVPLTLEFTADGKVSGSSPENGCKLLGVWSQGSPPAIVWLDITLNGCRFDGLDRRYTGSFLLAKPDSSGQLTVQASEMPRPGQGARSYDLKGVLRR